jgi:hypothetical protein
VLTPRRGTALAEEAVSSEATSAGTRGHGVPSPESDGDPHPRMHGGAGWPAKACFEKSIGILIAPAVCAPRVRGGEMGMATRPARARPLADVIELPVSNRSGDDTGPPGQSASDKNVYGNFVVHFVRVTLSA